MIDLPVKAEVNCSDGVAGISRYFIGHQVNHQITHLVVKTSRPPFREVLVPVDQVEETSPDRIKLKCTLGDLNQMEPFEVEEYISTQLPYYLVWGYVFPCSVTNPPEVETHVLVKNQNIPMGEVAVRRDARVEATDGYLGQVDELLVNSNNLQVTHLILLKRHIFKQREIAIPLSQIDHVSEDTVYLKLDKKGVEELPTVPIQRWLRSKSD